MAASRSFWRRRWVPGLAVLVLAGFVVSPAGPTSAAAAPSQASVTYVRWILTNVAGLTPTSDQVDAYATFLDRGGSRVTVTAAALYHDQPLGFLVQQAYQSALARKPNQAEGDQWIRVIQSRRRSLAQVQITIASSPEALRANGGSARSWVTAPYELFLMRAPRSSEAAYWGAQATTQEGRRRVARAIHASPQSRRAFVRFFIQVLFSRVPDAPGLAYWSSQLPRFGELSLVARLLASNEMYRQIQLNPNAADGPAPLREFAHR